MVHRHKAGDPSLSPLSGDFLHDQVVQVLVQCEAKLRHQIVQCQI